MTAAILAKSPYQIDGKVRRVRLADHARDVLRATDLMFGAPGDPTRLAKKWLRFFKLPTATFDAFLQNLRLAAVFHDLGKANDGFQAMVHGRGHQDIRHEHLSALLLWLPEMRQWLARLKDYSVDPEIVVSSVLSHHLKANHKGLAAPLTEASKVVRVFAASDDVRAVLQTAADLFAVEPPDLSGHDRAWRFDREIAAQRDELRDALRAFRRMVHRDDTLRRLTMAVKAALLAVDSAGSAAARTAADLDHLDRWLRSAFGIARLTPDDIQEKVIQPRVEELKQAGIWRGYQKFQIEAANLGPRALLLASCGSGKTLAAWKWIAARLALRKASRVLFLYPTRATATEGFRDYVSWAGPEEAALVSGTAHYDLQELFANPGSGRDPRSGGDYAVDDRLFALAYWERRIFSATVDSFLACMTNRYAALCLLPLLVDSIVVVDEVHSFDPSMFKALERLLDEFDVPVLCMTASLPKLRREFLIEKRGMEPFPRELSDFPDLESQSGADRYRIHQSTELDAHTVALTALRKGKRVMWVVNTVRRCQRVARSLVKTLGEDPNVPKSIRCYHSRFKLEHRRARHNQVVLEFKRGAGATRPDDRGLILVTTQVCEMSLDLDADILITELAPVPALIQRMGRCCRVPDPGERRGEVYVYPPEGYPDGGERGARPYTAKELRQGEAFIAALSDRGAITQLDLADELEKLPTDELLLPESRAAFPDSGPYAMAREDTFRDDDGYVVDAVLDSDVDLWLAARHRREPAEGYVVPVPRGVVSRDSRLGAFLYRAPGDRYHPFLGFLEEVPVDA